MPLLSILLTILRMCELHETYINVKKKLSCRRENSRRFVWLNISLSHSSSLKVIRNDTLEQEVCKSLFHSIPLKPWPYFVPFVTYSASNNGVTLKSGAEVVQGRWKRRRSIDHIGPTTYYWSAVVSIALTLPLQCLWRDSVTLISTLLLNTLSCTIFELFDVK